MTITQPLKWHGGKSYLAKWIRENAPPHGSYVHRVHVYGGGLAEFWAWPHDGVSEVVNDVNYQLSNFWLVMRQPELFEQFLRAVAMTPFSAISFGESGVDQAAASSIEQAVAFFVRYRQSRQGLGEDFATLSRNRTRRRMNEQVSAWLSSVDGLSECHQRLQRVAILCADGPKVIRQQDGRRTHFYCDPTYWGEERTSKGQYKEFEMKFDQHVELLDTLSAIAGTFQLSGYHSPLYDNWASQHGFRCIEIEIDNKAASGETKEKRTECLWMNY